eukprot:1153782-Pelagomonas_calceolata.AAC.2
MVKASPEGDRLQPKPHLKETAYGCGYQHLQTRHGRARRLPFCGCKVIAKQWDAPLQQRQMTDGIKGNNNNMNAACCAFQSCRPLKLAMDLTPKMMWLFIRTCLNMCQHENSAAHLNYGARILCCKCTDTGARESTDMRSTRFESKFEGSVKT